jgi:hypothetical protein
LAPSTSIHECWQVEDVKSLMQEKLTPSRGMMEKDDSSYYSFSRQDGEFSKMVEAMKTSDEEVLHKQLVLPSSPGKGNICKTSLERDVHSKEGVKTFPNSKMDKNIWCMYPCASCGNSNHNMDTCRRRQFVQENPSKKKAKGKGHFSKQRKRVMTRRDHDSKVGKRYSDLIMVRVDIILRSVG